LARFRSASHFSQTLISPLCGRYGAGMKILIILSLLLSSFTGKAYDYISNVECSNNLELEIISKNKVSTFSFWDNFKFNNDLPLVFGSLVVDNPTKNHNIFTTKSIILNINGVTSRAYVKTNASVAIDHAGVTIEPGGFLSLSVYWPVSEPIDKVLNKMSIECVDAP